MTSVSETGHAKNVTTLAKYNLYLVGLGTKYSPATTDINLAAMQTLYTNAQASIDQLKIAMDIWKTETNERETAFAKLAPFCSRLLGILRSTNAKPQMIDDMAALIAKVRSGSRKATPPTSEPAGGATNDTTVEPQPTRSTSQLSFDQRIDNYSKIVLMLKNFPGYAPTEPELTILSLEEFHTDLVTWNLRAAKADVDLRNARITRNNALYAPDTGLIDRVKKSKAYILGIYGRSSEQYANATSYKFTKRSART